MNSLTLTTPDVSEHLASARAAKAAPRLTEHELWLTKVAANIAAEKRLERERADDDQRNGAEPWDGLS